MAYEIVMPNLGFDTQEAQIVEWLKRPGDKVTKGEAIAIIETDKASVELESVGSGFLEVQLYAEGDSVPVGAVIGRVGPQTSGELAAEVEARLPEEEAAPQIQASPLARRVAEKHDIDLEHVEGSGSRGRIRRQDVEAYLAVQGGNGANQMSGKDTIMTLPIVRKRARESGIDLALVPGTGPQGAITVADFERFLSAVPASETASVAEAERSVNFQADDEDGVQEVILSRMRQAIGHRLQQSSQEAPHFYVTGELDMEAALGQLRAMPSPQPSINDLLQYLAVRVLQRLPQFNAVYQDGRLVQYHAVNLSIAVAHEDGLITPVIPDAGRYSLSGLSVESRALIKRVRENRLQPRDLQAGTFTISNLGVMPQVDSFTAVINPPQVAILAIGTVKPRPVALNGGLHVRHTVQLTLSGDHRILDGMDLARFLAAFEEELAYFSHKAR